MDIKIKVGIEGISPLLMHKPNLEAHVTGQILSPEDAAAQAAYMDENGKFVIPSANMRACIHDGASGKKFGKVTARRALALCTIEPYMIPLKHDENDPQIDITPVVIPRRGRILRARPIFAQWGVEFILSFDDTEFKIPVDKVIEGWRIIIEYAGVYCGILDNRPSSPKKPGPHGRFAIKEYERID